MARVRGARDGEKERDRRRRRLTSRAGGHHHFARVDTSLDGAMARWRNGIDGVVSVALRNFL